MNIGDEIKLIMHDKDRCTITPMVVTGIVDSSNSILPESLNDSFNEIFSMPKIGDKFTISGVKQFPNGDFITDCVQGDETVFVNNVQPYSLKDDKRFMHADDVEETHVRGDWDRE